MKIWRLTALAYSTLAAISMVALTIYGLSRIEAVNSAVEKKIDVLERRMQELSAHVSYADKRGLTIIRLRDQIMRINPSVQVHEAYQYAELAVNASERYPSVDPVLLVSIGAIESAYDTRAVSRAGARGLYQIWPSTGRILARSLGWEYTDEMLHDPTKNTELAALYLEILFSVYRDTNLVLAEYNGGPLNAGYWRANHWRIAEETKDYVAKVSATYEVLKGV
jgi:soluble lytic murein transglycosylase-like protein